MKNIYTIIINIDSKIIKILSTLLLVLPEQFLDQTSGSHEIYNFLNLYTN